MGAEQSSAQIEQTLFQLRFTAKQLERMSTKAEKEQEKQKQLVKKAVQQKNLDGARIYAENAIRKKNEALNYLRLASRIDAVQSRVKTAMSMKQITKDMGMVTKGLDKAMASMDLAAMTAIMDKFETQFADLDVRSGLMEASMNGAMTLSAPEDQIEDLIKTVADEHSLELTEQMHAAQVGTSTGKESVGKLSTTEDQDLSRRLAMLRNA